MFNRARCIRTWPCLSLVVPFERDYFTRDPKYRLQDLNCLLLGGNLVPHVNPDPAMPSCLWVQDLAELQSIRLHLIWLERSPLPPDQMDRMTEDSFRYLVLHCVSPADARITIPTLPPGDRKPDLVPIYYHPAWVRRARLLKCKL